MRPARTPSSPEHFLGVRLTAEEIARLDQFQRDQGLSTRSDAVRALVRAAEAVGPESVELPVTLHSQLESVVEDGYARDLAGALTLALHLGLGELVRLHSERLPALRRTARDASESRQRRRRASREGGALLER